MWSRRQSIFQQHDTSESSLLLASAYCFCKRVSNNSHGRFPLRHHLHCRRAAVSDRRVEFTPQKTFSLSLVCPSPRAVSSPGCQQAGLEPRQQLQTWHNVSPSPSPAPPWIHCSTNPEIGCVSVSKGGTLAFGSYSSRPPPLLSPALELGCSVLCHPCLEHGEHWEQNEKWGG